MNGALKYGSSASPAARSLVKGLKGGSGALIVGNSLISGYSKLEGGFTKREQLEMLVDGVLGVGAYSYPLLGGGAAFILNATGGKEAAVDQMMKNPPAPGSGAYTLRGDPPSL